MIFKQWQQVPENSYTYHDLLEAGLRREVKEIYGEITVQILRLKSVRKLSPEIEFDQYEDIAEMIEHHVLNLPVPDGWELEVER